MKIPPLKSNGIVSQVEFKDKVVCNVVRILAGSGSCLANVRQASKFIKRLMPIEVTQLEAQI